MRSSNLYILANKLVFASGSAILHPHLFWRGTELAPPLLLFLLHEVAFNFVRVYFASQTQSGERFAPGQRKIVPDLPSWIMPMAIAGILLNYIANPAVYLAPKLVEFAVLPFDRYTSTFLGVVSSISCLVIMFCSHYYLGENWSSKIETRKKHQLVTTGIYSYLRHPMYTAFFLWALACTLLSHNWLCGLSCTMVAVATACRIPTEEALMMKTFGKEYEAYRDRTWALVPFLSRRKPKEGTFTF
mmetsp:Transcript_13865/g.34840  ORF Transcript_13865/g.34840 Transcript_13865/m.34840 type:complete len:244 (+) Transcript_13865:155-886(+)